MIVLGILVMPFFEWQIIDFTTNFPSNYEVYHLPMPWMAKLGDSLDDNLYSISRISVSKDGRNCFKEDLNFVVNRSQNDKALEHKWLNIKEDVSWLVGWSLIEIALSGFYILWFGLWYRKGSEIQTIVLLGVALCSFIYLVTFLNSAGRFIPHQYLGLVDCDSGTVTFTAKLSKIHYETLVVLAMGISAEVGALWIMVRQMRMATLERSQHE
jgi:hypothetical protein